MKLPGVLVALIPIALLVAAIGCSTTPTEVAPTPNIEATVEVRVAQERAVDATVEVRVAQGRVAQERAIDATVEVRVAQERVAQERAIDAAVEARLNELVASQPTQTPVAVVREVASTDSPAPAPTPAPEPTITLAPTDTPSPTNTPVPTLVPTATPMPVPTSTPLPISTATAVPTPTPTPVPTPTPTPISVLEALSSVIRKGRTTFTGSSSGSLGSNSITDSIQVILNLDAQSVDEKISVNKVQIYDHNQRIYQTLNQETIISIWASENLIRGNSLSFTHTFPITVSSANLEKWRVKWHLTTGSEGTIVCFDPDFSNDPSRWSTVVEQNMKCNKTPNPDRT